MEIWLYTIISVFLISIISLIGVFTLSLKKERLQKILLYLVSFAAGALFGDAFIHLIPESFRSMGATLTVSLLIIAGILIFFILEKLIRWRHCHIPVSQNHIHPVATMNLIGDAAHNFTDGIIIAISYLISIPIGIATTIAVVLHEIPQEIGDFGVLIYGKLSIKRALLFNFLSGVLAIVGAVIALIIGHYVQGFALVMLPITAGGFLYIAGSDLVPELQRRCDNKISAPIGQLVLILLGIAVMALLTLLD